ncbi:MAG TPA: hypothetical protein VFX76_02500 [Roseiflexaceae bacterium]|nr:hypothetical protein [Roseiflexaceae bacterium]
MSYFDAGVGKRPAQPASVPETPAEKQPQPEGYFAASLGLGQRPALNRLQQADPYEDVGAHPLTRSPAHLLACPLCRGALEEREGIYQCVGRCNARWLEEAPGRLVDLAALPLGICRCCRPPTPLVHGALGEILCPRSGRAHLLLPGGASALLDALPHGVCPCCQPAMPLVAQGDQLACLAHPERRYERNGERLVPITTAPDATATLQAIDTALRRNSARLTTNGLFDLD